MAKNNFYNSALFGLVPTIPRLPPIPDLPPQLISPAGMVVLVGLTAGAILVGGQSGPAPRKPHKDKDGRDLGDSNQVVKVSEAVDAVEKVLFTPGPVFGNLIIKAITQAGKAFFDIKHEHWTNFSDLEHQSDEIQLAIFSQLADEIEDEIRDRALQQANLRRQVTASRFIRLGKQSPV